MRQHRFRDSHMQALQSNAQLVVKSPLRILLQRSKSFRFIKYILLVIFNPEIIQHSLHLVTQRNLSMVLLLIVYIICDTFYL